jgi:SAM-dependent methyltransferase
MEAISEKIIKHSKYLGLYGAKAEGKIRCPICLSTLRYVPANGQRSELVCDLCHSTFHVIDGLPVFLLADENWQKKSDEIDGEVQYNTKKIPPEVHVERNAFVDKNTKLFLDEAGVDLTGREILAVGCSMAELDFYSASSDQVVCLDIVPQFTKASRKTTLRRDIKASWICGDGECLPLASESFDIVIVRQTLHHMLKYYAAISEFFRVCRLGGIVAIVDEPFTGFDPNDMILNYQDAFRVCGDVLLGQIKKSLGISSQTLKRNVPVKDKSFTDLSTLEKERQYVQADSSDPETLLADKYHVFSLLNCIHAIKMHTDDLTLTWSMEVAWTDSSGDTVKFCHGPNPHFDKSLLEKLVAPGNVSIAAKKLGPTKRHRKREGLRAISLEALSALL